MPLIIADSQFIENKLLASVVIVGKFPALQNYKATLASISAECSTCAGKKSEAEKKKREVWNNVRSFLAMLPDPQKQELRKLLNLKPGDRLRVSFTSGTGTSAQIQSREF